MTKNVKIEEIWPKISTKYKIKSPHCCQGQSFGLGWAAGLPLKYLHGCIFSPKCIGKSFSNSNQNCTQVQQLCNMNCSNAVVVMLHAFSAAQTLPVVGGFLSIFCFISSFIFYQFLHSRSFYKSEFNQVSEYTSCFDIE